MVGQKDCVGALLPVSAESLTNLAFDLNGLSQLSLAGRLSSGRFDQVRKILNRDFGCLSPATDAFEPLVRLADITHVSIRLGGQGRDALFPAIA